MKRLFDQARALGRSFDIDLKVYPDATSSKWLRCIGNFEMVNNQPDRFFMAFQDVTHHKEMEQKLINAREEAYEASQAKSDFLANMSHEIRTPLNGVIGFTDLVLRTNLNETQRHYLTIAKESGATLLNIINDILDFSKIEAGRLELNEEKTDIFELSREVVNILSYQAQNKGLEMLLNIDPDAPRFVYGDPIRLKQILVNLTSNAIKFTDEGEVELMVYPKQEQGNGNVNWYFGVRDTGIGIEKERQEDIFDAFTQAEVSTTKRFGGTGLGLAISNNLLHLMNSRLRLSSKLGEGSVFYFEVEFPSEEGKPEKWDISWLKKALVVDDNENNRKIVKEILRDKDIIIEEAQDGFSAFNKIRNGSNYDLVLMDYRMPYMDGLETIKKFSALYEDEKLPYILVLHSSVEDESFFRQNSELPMVRTLTKPIIPGSLLHVLSNLNKQKKTTDNGSPSSTPISDASYRILIAEDAPVNMKLITTIIKKYTTEAEIVEAVDGQEAIEHCREQIPDLIFMDLLMPEVNGYEATAKIREMPNGEKVPILALTAATTRDEKEKCLRSGFDDFITKPVESETVRSKIKEWIEPSPV